MRACRAFVCTGKLCTGPGAAAGQFTQMQIAARMAVRRRETRPLARDRKRHANRTDGARAHVPLADPASSGQDELSPADLVAFVQALARQIAREEIATARRTSSKPETSA
jgi:hypothetical protein